MLKFLSSAALLLALTPTLRAEDFTILFDPATGLRPDSPVLNDYKLTEKEPGLLHQYSPQSDPNRLTGTSPKDAPNTTSFILLFEKPSAVSYSAIQLGYPADNPAAKVSRFPYRGVVAVQAFSLWHRPDPGTNPVLLGRGFYWGRATQIKIIKPGSEPTFVVVNRSLEELTHMAVADQYFTYPSLLADCWSPSVVVQKPIVNVTPQRVLEWGKMPTAPPAAYDLPPSEQRKLRDSYFTPAAVLTVRTTYKPSRITKDPNGNPVVELDLHNRLPVTARGSLECRQEYTAVHNVNHTPTPPRVLKQTPKYTFRLQPGDKDVAKFVLPPGTDSQTLNDLVIQFLPTTSYLGDYIKKPTVSKNRKKN